MDLGKIFLFPFLVLCFCSVIANAADTERVADCEVFAVYDNGVFEEGLSRFEYPSLTVEKTTETTVISIGVMQEYDSSDETHVEYQRSKSGEFTILFSRKESSTVFHLSQHEVFEYNEEGEEEIEWHAVLLYGDKRQGNINWKPLASFLCKAPN